jgi:hypothetical protein
MREKAFINQKTRPSRLINAIPLATFPTEAKKQNPTSKCLHYKVYYLLQKFVNKKKLTFRLFEPCIVD